MPRGYYAERVWQKVSENLSKGVNLDPSSIREYFVESLVGRSFSYLFGWDQSTGDPVKVRVTSAGDLITATSGSALANNHTVQLNIAAGGTQTIVFTHVTSRLDLWAVGANLSVERSVDGVVFQDAIIVYAGGYLSVDATQLQVRLTNPSSTAAQTGQVVGWW